LHYTFHRKLQEDITAAQDEGERQQEAAEQSRKREEAAKNHAQQLQTEMEQLQERADKMELLGRKTMRTWDLSGIMKGVSLHHFC